MKKPANPPLTFEALRAANIARIPQFKNARGELAHAPVPGAVPGADWSPAQWLQAVTGELGEYANVRKKYERGDFNQLQFLPWAAEELADVVIYLDILAFQLGIDLEDAVRYKFNAVSQRQKIDVIV